MPMTQTDEQYIEELKQDLEIYKKTMEKGDKVLRERNEEISYLKDERDDGYDRCEKVNSLINKIIELHDTEDVFSPVKIVSHLQSIMVDYKGKDSPKCKHPKREKLFHYFNVGGNTLLDLWGYVCLECGKLVMNEPEKENQVINMEFRRNKK